MKIKEIHPRIDQFKMIQENTKMLSKEMNIVCILTIPTQADKLSEYIRKHNFLMTETIILIMLKTKMLNYSLSKNLNG